MKYTKDRTEWQRRKRNKEAEIPDPVNKVQCRICRRWYIQLGGHVVQAHGYKTARQYREEFNLEVKRGTVPLWYRELKGKIALENGTWKNLRAGESYRFEKGSKTAGKYERSPITIKRLKKWNK